MSAVPRTTSQDSADGLRKRVGKACDRCRLKKSKCDGSSPCSRCRIDNAICVFGERKKSHDKVYPKGYVEMLEQQQSQLIAGLQETYRRLFAAQIWPGDALSETEGHPLTHDILARLGILDHKASDPDEVFEEDCEQLQQRLISQGAPLDAARRGSFSSESDHSLSHGHKRARSMADRPKPSSGPAKTKFRKSCDLDSSRFSSPIAASPSIQAVQVHPAIQPSPLHGESPVQQEDAPLMEDDVLLPSLASSLSWDWHNMVLQGNTAQEPQPDFTMSPVSNMQATFDNWQGFEVAPLQFNGRGMNPFDNNNHLQMPIDNTARTFPAPNMNNNSLHEWQNIDVDFSKFVKAAT